jgi:hypothetical protein
VTSNIGNRDFLKSQVQYSDGHYILVPREFIAAILITRLCSSPCYLASSILGNDKALWDEQGLDINWAGMNSLVMSCPAINCPSAL